MGCGRTSDTWPRATSTSGRPPAPSAPANRRPPKEPAGLTRATQCTGSPEGTGRRRLPGAGIAPHAGAPLWWWGAWLTQGDHPVPTSTPAVALQDKALCGSTSVGAVPAWVHARDFSN